MGLPLKAYKRRNKQKDDRSGPPNNDTKSLKYRSEEVHRYAIGHFRKKHEKRLVKSELENIPGIGPQKRIKLLKHFKSIKNIKNASLDELLNVIDKKTAQNIFDYYNKK